MRLRVNRQELAEALSLVTGVVAVRTPKPILQCVKIDAEADHVLLACTDLELGLRYAVTQVEVEKKGQALVSADTFTRIVKESADEVLLIDSADGKFHVRGADSHFQINESALEDFPPVSEMEGKPHFTVTADRFRRMTEWTLFACARESTRYAINGVLFDVGDRLTLVATDGRRLSRAAGDIQRAGKAAVPQAIVQPKALALLNKFSMEADEPVGVQINDNRMVIRAARATISTSLVEGHFPKYQDVIPQDCDKSIELDTAAFLSALRRAALLTNEESKGVRLSFSEEGLTLSSRAPEQGEATINVQLSYRGEPIDIGFNPHFLIEALKVVRESTVMFRCSSGQRPGLLEADSDREFIYVIMPVSLA